MPLMLQSLVPELNPPKLQLLRFHCFIYFVSRWNRATKKVSPFWYGVWDRCGALHSTENQHLKNAKEKTQKTLIGSESNMSGLHLILEPCKICNDLVATFDFTQSPLSLRAYLQGHPGRRKRDPVCKPTCDTPKITILWEIQ